MKRDHLASTVALFALTAAAFANAQYALGAWLAVGTVATAAYGLAFTWFADRPATVDAIEMLANALADSQAAQVKDRAETERHLADYTKRLEHLQTFLSAATVATRQNVGGAGPFRGPVGSGSR